MGKTKKQKNLIAITNLRVLSLIGIKFIWLDGPEMCLIVKVFSLLFNLLKEVKECDTKLNVLNVLSYFIGKPSTSFCRKLITI